MRRLWGCGCLVTALAIAGACQAEDYWLASVGSDSAALVDADAVSRTEGGDIQAQVELVYLQALADRTQYFMAVVDMNCKTYKSSTMSISGYDLDGGLVSQDKHPQEAVDNVPGSIGGKVLEFVCEDRSLWNPKLRMPGFGSVQLAKYVVGVLNVMAKNEAAPQGGAQPHAP